MPKCLSLILITFLKYRLILICILSNVNGAKQSSEKVDLIIFYIKENSPINKIVGQVRTLGFPPPYFIDNVKQEFSISKNKGIIKVSGPIDREKQDTFSFLIISSNGETKSVEIKVTDENDNEPKFNVSSLEKSIPENYPVGSKVDLTTVFDPDEGNNSVQSVRIISGDSEKNFAIDYHDGSKGVFYTRLILKQPLDYESISQFNLVIQAIDGGRPALQSVLIVKINVQNANDNVPKFDISRYIASIKENQAINKTFLRVRATDNDAGISGELFYFIESNSAESKFFAVHHKTGDVSLRKSLNFEASKSHQISIGVRDNSPPFHISKVPLIIDVIDVNDNAPEIEITWTRGSPKIDRNIEPNSIVAHIKVLDLDAISTSFELKISNETPLKLIKILPKMWELRIIKDLNDFKRNTLTLTLIASDNPDPILSTTKTVTIILEQSILSEISFSQHLYVVELDSPIFYENHPIITLEIINKSPVKSSFYFLLMNGKTLFKINETSGELLSSNPVDCGEYRVNVSLYSSKLKSTVDRSQIQITIKQDRKLPLYFETGFRKFLINMGKTQCFHQVAVKNRHCGLRARYYFDPPLKTDSPVFINKHGTLCTTGVSNDKQSLSGSYLVRIRAVDEDNSSAFLAALMIPQHSPKIESITREINITLPVLSVVNKSVPIARFLATFSDLSPNSFRGFVQYHVLPDEETTELLSVDFQSGEVFMKKYPKDKTIVKVRVKVSSINKTSTSIVNLLRIDFQKIHFTESLYQFIIGKEQLQSSTIPIGQVLIKFDPTQKESISVLFRLHNSDDYKNSLFIDQSTGMILGRNLHLIPVKTVSLSVLAVSGSEVVCYAQVLVSMEKDLDVPVFSHPKFSIDLWENMTVGNEIFQIVPKYPSLSDVYNINPSQFSSWVTIHHKTGQLFLRKQFDREKISSATITVVLNNQIDSTNMDLQFNILDINDNAPQCKSSQINISLEDKSDYGTKICPLQCFDPDSPVNANLSYSMKMLSPRSLNNPFRIESNTGCLVTISSLEMWLTNPMGKVNLSVIVSDNGPSQDFKTHINIQVHITDTNNHSPKLISNNVFHVLETASYGTEIGTLLIEDEDRGLNAEVSVSLQQSHYKQCIYLEKINSSIFIIRSKHLSNANLNLGPHNIILTLSDKGSPPRSSSASIILHIVDTNNNVPEILFPKQNEPVSFKCPLMTGSEIFTVQSVDLDQGLNARRNYSIHDLQDINNLISIDIWSGLVTAKSTLSCLHNPRFRISVTDLGYPKKSSFIDTFLKPQPAIERNQPATNVRTFNFTFIIQEDSPPGLWIGDLNVYPDYLGAKYLFSSKSPSTSDNVLHLGYDSQQLIFLNDDAKITKVSYPVVVTFHKSIMTFSPIVFHINLIINRFRSPWPVFSADSPTIVRVKENLPAGSIVGKFSIKIMENIAVIFSLRQPGDYFVMNPETGLLVTFRSLDRERETQDYFSIEIFATHIGDPKRISVIPVSVFIEDENDNSPVIMSPSNNVVLVAQGISLDTSIIRIISRDDDKESNAILRYSIRPIAGNIFSINQTSGDISLISAPKETFYELNITIADSGVVPKVVWSVFSISFKTSENKHRIKLSSDSLSMNISLPQNQAGFILGRVTQAQTSSENLDSRYNLIAGRFAQIFAIHPISGEIRTQHAITTDDMGNTEMVQLSVVLQNVKDPSIYDIGTISINLDYGNQNSPKFYRPFYKVRLPEDESITDFLTVSADDPDLSIYGKVSYRLSGDINDKTIFIDPTTGRLSCSPLNYMEKNTYNLEVTAFDSDGGRNSRSSSTKVTIFVQNTRQHPLEFNSTHYSLKVMENAPAGTVIGRINVVKPPVNSELIYVLNPGHSHIQLNSSTGEFRTNGLLHRDRIQFIDLTIQAFTKSFFTRTIQSTSAIIDIRIVDVNDNPPIPTENPVKIYIPDTSLLPKPLAKLSATDADKVSSITYKFDMTHAYTQSLASLYYLDAMSGNLFCKFPTKDTQKIRHLLSVIVSDNGIPNKSVRLLVDISLNQNPEYLPILPDKAIFRVVENSVPGTFIGQLKAVNNCSNGLMRFSIIDGVNNELVFLEGSGKIFVAVSGNIDREVVETIILWTQVTCMNHEKKVGYKKVIIHVEDVDDNRPVFAQSNYVAFLNEGQPPKTSVIRTTVYDPDVGINSQVEYFIELYSSQEEFSIDSNGEVKTNVPLNFHTKSMYNIVIKATSKASPLNFAECRLTVHIININDQRPIISPSKQILRLERNTPVGSPIIKITAKDSDGIDGICYRIRHRILTNDSLFLSVAYDSGEISLSRKLRVADIGKHELEIVADDGKFSSSAIIEANVIDDNNHMPILRENGQTIILPSAAKPGSTFFYLHADDRDLGENARVVFELITPSSLFGLRSLNNNTAFLYLIDELSQTSSPYILGIQLTDSSSDRRKRLTSVSSIVIMPESTNPNPPIFTKDSTSNIRISEFTSPGTKIAKVACKDHDTDQSIAYIVKKTDEISSLFYVDMELGDVFLTNRLNYSLQQRHHVVITCEDSGLPQRTATFNLTITVDKGHKWLALMDNKKISINLQISDIVKLPALVCNVEDSQANLLHLSYRLLSITPDNPDNIIDPPDFNVDSRGNIWLMGGHLLQCKSWILTIKVLDKGQDPNSPSSLYKSIYMFVHITITDHKAGTLKRCVSIRNLTGVILENEPPITQVLDLPNWYTDIKYSFATHENFELYCDQSHDVKCKINTKTILDFEKRDQYRLQLVVTGSFAYMKSCSHILMLEISVLDVDEYFPEFTQQSYSHSVDGGVPKLGQILYTIQATDKDKGRFGLVSYQLTENNHENFGIQNDTGAIFIKSNFADDVESVKRIKRSTTEKGATKFHRKSFLFRVSASSGIKISYAVITLSVLVPGESQASGFGVKMSDLHIIIVATVTITVVICIIVFTIIFLLKRKFICVKAPVNYRESSKHSSPSSRTESPKTPNSWNTQNSHKSQNYTQNRYNTDHRKLPDIANIPLNIDNIPNSETQDFSLSSDECRIMTSSMTNINENQHLFSHSSETSIKFDDQIHGTYPPEFNNNGVPYSQLNCDSGIEHSHRMCDYYDDSGMDNKRIPKVGFEQNNKYQDSNVSLTSSSGYSAISNNNQHAKQQRSPYKASNRNQNIPYPPVFVNNNSIHQLRSGPIKPSMGTNSSNRLRQGISSTLLKSNSQPSDFIQLQSVNQYGSQRLIDVRNNNHPSTLPLIPTHPEDYRYFTEPNVGYFAYHRDFAPSVIFQSPPTSLSAINNNPRVPEAYTQTYTDITEI